MLDAQADGGKRWNRTASLCVVPVIPNLELPVARRLVRPRPALTRLALVAVVPLLAAACASGEGGSAPPAGAPGDVLAAAESVPPGSGTAASGITVTGTGRVSGTPDTLRATVGVEVERESVGAALTAANDAARQVLDALRGAGVADEDLQTLDVAVYPRFGDRAPTEGGDPAIRGYVASNLVEATLGDLDRAGEILDMAVRAAGDAARLHNVSFSLEDNEELVRAARQRAFTEARSNAEQYAELAGAELGDLVAISEVSSPVPSPMAFADTAEAAASSVPIEPGSQAVSVTVRTVWSLG